MSLECDFLRGINFLAVTYIEITSTAKEVSLPPLLYVDEAHTYFYYIRYYRGYPKPKRLIEREKKNNG